MSRCTAPVFQRLRYLLLIGWWLGVVFCFQTVHLRAASAEGSLFDAAARGLSDHNWDYADRTFADFLLKFPNSDRAGEAAIKQAQARFELRNYDGVLELVSRFTARSGRFADEYVFWSAQAQLQKGDLPAASAGFQKLLATFPASARRLDSALGEAVAIFRQGNLARAAQLLTDPSLIFQTAAKGRPQAEQVLRGTLLAAEARLGLGDAQPALDLLNRLPAEMPRSDLAWERDYLRLRCRVALGQGAAALSAASNLVVLATRQALPGLQARSLAMLGDLLEKAGETSKALEVHTATLDPRFPEPERRQALDRLIAIRSDRQEWESLDTGFQAWLAAHPAEPLADVMQLARADSAMARYWGLSVTNRAGVGTNQLVQARASLNLLIQTQTNSVLLGHGLLQRGWVAWELSGEGRDTNSINQALMDFEAAASRLPHGEEQAVALFKSGDCWSLLGDPLQARTNYQKVLARFAEVDAVRKALWDKALYKVLETSVGLKDLPTAGTAVQRILADYPEGFVAERSLLRWGQGLSREGRLADARSVFERFLASFPNSPMSAEVELAVARTHATEGHWTEAAAAYDRWVESHTNRVGHADVRFEQAWVAGRSGDTNRATALFARFLSDLPTHPQAPWAQIWLADRDFTLGRYLEAESRYQKVFQDTNWTGEVAWQARISAGRAAFARQGFAEARTYFAALVEDPKCPPNTVAEALFAMGDTFIQDPAIDPSRPLDRFAEAIKPFARITQSQATNHLAAAAWVKVGHCHFQLASQDLPRYEQAAAAYTNALLHPLADVAIRSEAEFGLGLVREKQGLLSVAQDHFSNLIYGRNLRPGEVPDHHWLESAGNKALRIAELRRDTELVRRLCDRLARDLPELAENWRLRRDKALERIGGEKPGS